MANKRIQRLSPKKQYQPNTGNFVDSLYSAPNPPQPPKEIPSDSVDNIFRVEENAPPPKIQPKKRKSK